eukprot:UN01751
MSDKFGVKTVSSISPDPKTTYPIVLGKSFFVNQNRHRPTGFVSATYRFKPSSVDQSKPGNISFDKTTASLKFERRSNGNNNTNNGRKATIKFQGKSKLASNHEFFLWFDASSQKMVLEKSGIQIKQLRHDREQKKPQSHSYSDTSKDRMKLMDKKHRREKNKSLKNNKKKQTKLIKAKQMNMNNNNSDTCSTRSSSQSISPYHPQPVTASHPPTMPNNNNVGNIHAQNAQFRSNNNQVH